MMRLEAPVPAHPCSELKMRPLSKSLAKHPEILRFNPFPVEKTWGGTKLREQFGKPFRKDARIGESWEVAENEDGVTTVSGGRFDGWAPQDLLGQDREALLGNVGNLGAIERFPLMLKLIDANDILSVQVHPNDKQAQELEGLPFGKTEAWFILDAEPGAWIVYGLKEGVGEGDLRERIEKDEIETALRKVPVRRGDVVAIQAGVVHALGKGIVVAEIQQNTNVTYRLYDWGRVGQDGTPRELHVERALKVIDYDARPEVRRDTDESPNDQRDPETDYFDWRRIQAPARRQKTENAATCQILLCIDGYAVLRTRDGQRVAIGRGESALAPAALGAYEIESESGAEILLAGAR